MVKHNKIQKKKGVLINGSMHEFEQFLSSQSDKTANKMWINKSIRERHVSYDLTDMRNS